MQTMSSDPASAKLKRTNNEDQDAQAQPAITKSQYWFDDGNVIIQIENTQFRLHRSILSRHSSVFRDMFDIPQPTKSNQDEELDGCPLIHLSDKASDFEHVMSMLYDRDWDMRAEISFDQCAAMLRLGQKYDIQSLFKEGLQRFRYDNPWEFSEWNNLFLPRDLGLSIMFEPMFYERAMALGYELSINRSLPGICLSVVQKEISAIIDLVEKYSKPNDLFYVPCHLWHQCLAGRDKILCRVHQRLTDWACLSVDCPIPHQNCKSIGACTSSKLLAIMKLSNSPNFFTKVEIMNPDIEIEDLICEECKASLKDAIDQFRAELWTDLPSIFDIGASWDDLKDF